MEKISSADLAKEVADKTGFSQACVKDVFKATDDAIQSHVKSGDIVTLAGLGTFRGAERKARDSRNPHTGEKINVPAHQSPAFKPSKPFKDLLK